MPRLWGLAGRGVRFSNAHSPVPLTLPAHTTLLTGLGPQHHGVRDNIGYALGPERPTVAESFAAGGWATAAFVGGYPLDRVFGLARGFEHYDDRMSRVPDDGREGHVERRATEVVESALAWLDGARPGPFFLWVHLFDPHDPYEAPPPFAGRHAQPYDDEVAYADHELGRLLDGVAGLRPGPCWIVVVADHGEALGEHGERTHGIFLYEETLRVPLVIVSPGADEPRVLDRPVSLADLAPTLLEAAGLEPLPGGDGQSLLRLLEHGRGWEPQPLYLESIHGRRRFGWAPLAGFLDWPEKYVAAPSPELYDLGKDTGETENLFTAARAAALEQRLAAARGTDGEELPAAEAGSGVDLERLASLGYVGAGGTALRPEAVWDRPRPDPKERVAALPAIERGVDALVAGRDEEARAALEEALRIDPDNLVTLDNLGILALRASEFARAEGLFREGLRRDRDAENLANNLGIALARLGRHAEAQTAFRRALAVRPGFTRARFNLAVALYSEGAHAEALRQLERVRSEEPGFPGLQAAEQAVRRSLAAQQGP
jgi:arylsulfatase A-like enzyme/Tfp pilus assembly protein PilF